MCHFGQRRRGPGAWDFKGKAGTLQVQEKEQICGKQILAGRPRNNGTQRELLQTDFYFENARSYFVNLDIDFQNVTGVMK